MSYDPSLLFDLSSSLFKDKNYEEESKYRTSVSRAYYAAFLVSRTYLEDEKKKPFTYTGKDHKLVSDFIKDYDPMIRNLLIELRKNRKHADYNITKKVELVMTTYSINCAKAVLDRINNMN